MNRWLRKRRAAGSERGVALVETAIVLPFLIVVFMGIWEFSHGWQSNLSTQTAVRAAARTGSGLGNDRAADYSMLQALKSSLTQFPSADIQRVVVFKATSSGTITAACKTGASSVSGVCNVYTGAQVNTLTAANFTAACAGSTGSAPDKAWCPTDRSASQANPDYVGVYVRVLSRYQSGFFPGTGLTIDKTMVMRIEPRLDP